MAAAGGGRAAKLFVAAIDFGTTYSGYAFSSYDDFQKEPQKINANVWNAGAAALMSHKTPTALLLNADQSFNAFGFEAETKYAELAEEDEDELENLYYFHRFKMVLHKHPKLRRTTKIKDEKGKEVAALKVFCESIRYLKDHLFESIKGKVIGIHKSDLHYVITVPAIWDDSAKQFMREAACQAGIKTDQLSIALEPEAASIYCQHLNIEKSQEFGQVTLKRTKAGTQYMVLDLGGGTADITVHERQYDNSLKELWPASGGPWGGKSIDDAFTEFIEDIFVSTNKDCTVLETLRQESMEDYIGLFREFETKKRSITSDKSGKVSITLPVVLVEVAKKCAKDSVEHCLEKSKYPEVKFSKQKLQMPAETFRKLFQPTVDGIVNLMDEILSEKSLRDVDTVLMVGGFAECELVQKAIRNKFPKKRIIVPEEAGLAVLKGAVLFGHMPKTVSARVARYTYGIQSWPMWNKDHHPVSKKVVLDGVARCKDVFFKFVERGQQVRAGHEMSQVFQALKPEESSLECSIYISTDTDPMFVDEPSCSQLGVLTVPIPSDRANTCIQVEETMVFGETELLVRARDLSTNQLYEATFDCL